MPFNIMRPKINATSLQEQVAQLRNYLYQLAESLEWALNTIEAGTDTAPKINTNEVRSDNHGN